MNAIINSTTRFKRIEFWAASTIFVFVVFFFITDGLDGNKLLINIPSKRLFDEAHFPFSFYSNYFVPELVRYIFLYLAYLYLNFVLVPKLLLREALVRNVFLLCATIVVATVVFGVTNTHLQEYLYNQYNERDLVDQRLFRESLLYSLWLLLAFAMYTAIKFVGLYLLNNTEAIKARYTFITREGIVAIVTWMFGLFLLILATAVKALILLWMIGIPSGIMLYLFGCYRLIPRSLDKKYPFLSYVKKNVLVLAISYFPITIIFLLFIHSDDDAFNLSFLNTVFQLFITVPVTWTIFKRKMSGNEEIVILKKELKQSTANIDFLRSQINPHFLFNALNTIYGTAMMEKADRTSEGIEKLADMMRFMLQENMQEKISLAREIEYLNNYIHLQKLRTDPNPVITIDVRIQEHVNLSQIAPMLLIPFVENAFKHGISFREPSQIKISLEVKECTLYFDVYNNKHVRPHNDPEKDKSGIGLLNVKQRLQLLYPGRHELITRETGKEFFVHLTINLGQESQQAV